jgi:signal peptidase I
MSSRRHTVARVAKSAFWWGLGALILAILGGYFGSAVVRGVYPPYVAVEGISMEPMLHVGDLVMLQHVTVKKLKKGDIIAFQTTPTVQKKYDVPAHFVHKIYKVLHEPNGQLEFQTKGIHNPSPDGFLTPSSMVIGEYAGDIPYAGYVVLFVQSKEGLILGGAIVAIIGIYILLGYLDERKAERQQITVDFARALGEMRDMVENVVEAVTPAHRPHGPPLTTGAAGAPVDRPLVDDRLEALVGAVSEYGTHLKSHTAVMQHLAATTDRLESATEGLLRAVATMGGARSGGSGLAATGAPASVVELLERASQTIEAVTRERDRLQERIAQLERDAATGQHEPPQPPVTSPALPPIWDVQPLPRR